MYILLSSVLYPAALTVTAVRQKKRIFLHTVGHYSPLVAERLRSIYKSTFTNAFYICICTCNYVYTVIQKNCTLFILNNSVTPHCMLITFGTQILE